MLYNSINRQALFFAVAFTLLFASALRTFAEGNVDSSQVSAEAATSAVDAADPEVTKALKKASEVLEKATKNKDEACALGDEKKKATDANVEAEELTKSVSGGETVKNKVSSAANEANAKEKDLCTTATSAFTKATEADTKAKGAKTKLDEARNMAADSGGGTNYKNKKDAADGAKTGATSAESEATQAETDVDKVTTTLNEFKNAVKSAQIGLHHVKIVVSADKIKKAHDTLTGYVSEATQEKTKAIEHQNALKEFLKDESPNNLKMAEEQTKILENAVTTSTSGIVTAQASAEKVKEYQNTADGIVKEIDTVTELNKAEEKSKNAEDTAVNAEKEVNIIRDKLSAIKNAVLGAAKAKHVANAIIHGSKVDALLKKIKENFAEANKKLEASISAVDSIKALQNTEPKLKEKAISDKINEKLQTSQQAHDEVKKSVGEITSSQNKVEEVKIIIDADVNAAKSGSDADEAEKHATKAKTEAEKTSNEENQSSEAMKKATEHANKAILTKHKVEAIVASSKLDASIAKINEYEIASKQKQIAAEGDINGMKTLINNTSNEMKQQVTQLIAGANEFLVDLKTEAEKVTNALRTAEAESIAVKGLVDALENENDESSAKQKAATVNTSATKTKTKENEAKDTLDKVIEKSKKIEKIKYEIHTITALSKASISAKEVKDCATQATQKKNEAISTVNAMKVFHTSANGSNKQSLLEKIKLVEKSLEIINENDKEVQNLVKEAETQKSTIDNLLEEIRKTDTTANAAKDLSEQAATAAVTAAEKIGKVKKALEDVNIETEKISTEKKEMNKSIEQLTNEKEVKGVIHNNHSSEVTGKKAEIMEKASTAKNEESGMDETVQDGREVKEESSSLNEHAQSGGDTVQTKEQKSNKKQSDSTVFINIMMQMCALALLLLFSVL